MFVKSYEKMKLGFLSISIPMSLCLVTVAVGQQAAPEQTAPNTTQESVVEEAERSTAQRSDPAAGNIEPDSQVFIPSEEVSEDRPIDFPVDI